MNKGKKNSMHESTSPVSIISVQVLRKWHQNVAIVLSEVTNKQKNVHLIAVGYEWE